MKKGIIFDVDGVIVDVSLSYHYAIKHTAEYFLKREVDIEDVRRIKFLRGINNDWLATLEVIKEFGKEESMEDIIKVFNEFYHSLRDREVLMLDKEFFESLRALGYPLGIVTGRPKSDLLYLFERHGLTPYFDAVVDEDTIPQEDLRKPHPYALHLCVETLELDSGVYVGDSLADWQMLKDYRKLYAKPFEYVHVGHRIKPVGVKVAEPDNLLVALQEVLQTL
ncbi:MAG: HAD family hydrolase [Aquificaceae bacterium]|nr:HAD family hydrolase [Aquificaceae bacterium]